MRPARALHWAFLSGFDLPLSHDCADVATVSLRCCANVRLRARDERLPQGLETAL